MSDYDFGDVYDCRNVPGVEHFIVIFGIQVLKGKKFILYERVTSRVYKAFKKLSDFFEGNCNGQCKKFKHNFKDTKHVYHVGKLCFTLFLDKDANYLDEDSMMVIKGEPEKTEANILEKWVKEGMAKAKIRISDVDVYKLMAILNNSDNISRLIIDNIRASFNKVDKLIKEQKLKKQLKKKKK
ncbi:MAG: hypothetical protein NT093_04285 [Candidatus Moranbacteria bacterium]|nr:hypothetical protein [Candidatus Moranbacteria bacterium]